MLRILQTGLLGFFLLFPTADNLLASETLEAVRFDVPAIVVAELIDPAVAKLPTAGGKLVRLRITISTNIAAEFRGRVDEMLVEFESPQQTMRVVDYWPKNEVFTELEGGVSIEESRQSGGELQISATTALEPIATGSTGGKYHNTTSVQQRYVRKPPLHILTSSGSAHRGYGVFFKFRPGEVPVVEGSREVAILAEVPLSWRADMLRVTMHASGMVGSSQRNASRRLGHSRLWMTIHQEGDLAAAAQTRRYMTQEKSLRAVAASNQAAVEQKALPTVWHKLGAAIDVIQPRIPNDYLSGVLFSSEQYLNERAHRLPIELRVAILDYWEQRNALLRLSGRELAHHSTYAASAPHLIE